MPRRNEYTKRKVLELHIVVEGFGEFPIDMLRYDAAFPLSEQDSALTTQHGTNRLVAVTMRALEGSMQARGPTVARWASFAWHVVGVFSDRNAAEECRDNRNRLNPMLEKLTKKDGR